MDSTLTRAHALAYPLAHPSANPPAHRPAHLLAHPSAHGLEGTSRLAAVREVRAWRAGQSLPARMATLLVPLVAVLAWCFLALDPVQARVQIDFDPMRPPAAVVAPAAAASATGDGAAAAAPAPSPGVPTLRITRQIGTGSNGSAAVLAALIDDTWVRRGDVVAGYRVTALRTESIDLVSTTEPGVRLTLRLNPVSVDRTDVPKAASAWPAVALEKK